MEGFVKLPPPPPEYVEVRWIADTLVGLMGAGWIINYVAMIWHSYQGKTYSMAILPLCCNIAWELAYTLVYPSVNPVELFVFAAGALLNVFIMVAATRAAKTEWAHSPIVADHTALILSITTLVCFLGHVCLAQEIGPGLAYNWGAVICQLTLSGGGLCQLLQRNSTRGTSWSLWSSRFVGSCCTVGFAYLRWKYWPEAFGWLSRPLVLWSLGTFVLLDTTYGICLYAVSWNEAAAASEQKRQKKM
ncbi:hypothetical protein ESCO_005798 [Escovopsis weberi]|uniref:Terpene cyclase janB n=1 Tax=Escovopsis weberi TaxID=150374 RepID=JANB_ESCWE|nr:hypothetical protein ESCO_005798 [Escovopsis weberi]